MLRVFFHLMAWQPYLWDAALPLLLNLGQWATSLARHLTLHTPLAEGPMLYLKARVDQNRKNDGSVGGDFQTYKPEGEVKKVQTAFVKWCKDSDVNVFFTFYKVQDWKNTEIYRSYNALAQQRQLSIGFYFSRLSGLEKPSFGIRKRKGHRLLEDWESMHA